MKHCQNIKLVKYPNYSLMPLYVLFLLEAGEEQIILKCASLAKQMKQFHEKLVMLSHVISGKSKFTEIPTNDTYVPNQLERINNIEFAFNSVNYSFGIQDNGAMEIGSVAKSASKYQQEGQTLTLQHLYKKFFKIDPGCTIAGWVVMGLWAFLTACLSPGLLSDPVSQE